MLIAFSVKALSEMPAQQAMALLGQGFNVPPACPFPFALSTQDSPPARSREAWFFEIFSGKASLSAACAKIGFKVLAFDHVVGGAQAATVPLDLCQEQGRALFWQLIRRNKPQALHGGPPCGTSSRARERPLPKSKFPNAPRPLRSKEVPLGLPSIKTESVDGIKLRKANALYKFTYLLILFCVKHDILISVENPANSHFWAVLAWFAEQDSITWPPEQLEFISFDACMHGSERPKRTAILGTKAVFAPLGVLCDGSHEHAPWGLYFRDGCSMWSTSSEAAYPAVLARRLAQCIADRVRSWRFPLVEHQPRPVQLAALGLQSPKFPPLIPEFYRVSWELAGFRPTKSCRILFSHASGVKDGGDKKLVQMAKKPRTGQMHQDLEVSHTGFPSPCPALVPEVFHSGFPRPCPAKPLAVDGRSGAPNPSGYLRPNPVRQDVDPKVSPRGLESPWLWIAEVGPQTQMSPLGQTRVRWTVQAGPSRMWRADQ